MCGLPAKLSEVAGRDGAPLVTEVILPDIAEKAINDGAIVTNPVGADEKDVLEILKRAF